MRVAQTHGAINRKPCRIVRCQTERDDASQREEKQSNYLFVIEYASFIDHVSSAHRNVKFMHLIAIRPKPPARPRRGRAAMGKPKKNAVADELYCGTDDDGHILSWTWLENGCCSAPRTNYAGTSGWATIVESNREDYKTDRK